MLTRLRASHGLGQAVILQACEPLAIMAVILFLMVGLPLMIIRK